MKAIIIAVLVLALSGCTNPPTGAGANHAEPITMPDDLEPEINETTIRGAVSSVGLYSCIQGKSGPTVQNDYTWVSHKVNIPEINDSVEATITIEWTPLNPTMEYLDIGLSKESGKRNPEYRESFTSPAIIHLNQSLLEQYSTHFFVIIYAGEECATPTGAGVQLARDGEQGYSGVVKWNSVQK